MLKAYTNLERGYTPPPLPALVNGCLKYEVDCVTKTQKEGKQREYGVHSVGYPDSSWENVKNLTNCPENLEKFWDAMGMQCPHSGPYKPRARS